MPRAPAFAKRSASPVPFSTPLPPISGGKPTRFPDTPVFGPNGNHSADFGPKEGAAIAPAGTSQSLSDEEFATREAVAGGSGEVVPQASAGFQEVENLGNHAQVVIPSGVEDDFRALLLKLGGNLTEAPLGRKKVFDDFMQGRLVSLLAIGLSLRQAGSALGVSHTAVRKELEKRAELREEIAAARFQAQVEPLLVILRESRRSWRAATWLVNYLNRQIAQREETPDEQEAREDAEAQAKRQAARQRKARAAREKEIEEQIENEIDYGPATEEQQRDYDQRQAFTAALREKYGLPPLE